MTFSTDGNFIVALTTNIPRTLSIYRASDGTSIDQRVVSNIKINVMTRNLVMTSAGQVVIQFNKLSGGF